MPQFKYYLTNRPPAIGTHPSQNLLPDGVECWMPAWRVEDLGHHAFGTLTYSMPLPNALLYKYELLPVDRKERARYFLWREADPDTVEDYESQSVEVLRELVAGRGDWIAEQVLILKGEM